MDLWWIHRLAEDLLYRTVVIKDKQRFSKRILIIGDEAYNDDN